MNRLRNSTSPYLLQHADNPVDWWPWCDGAFAEAAERDVPVLLSVGYAACHWCHVMAHESFEDPETAALINAHVVAVKVDREERPDVDAVYMTATQAMTGQGGWPMTVFMTPEGEPFFCGTYFPRDYFQQLVLNVSRAWRTQRDGVTGQAKQVAAALAENASATARALREMGQGEAGPPGQAETGARFRVAADAALRALDRDYDAADGGFGGAPKFPPSMVLEFLLRHHQRTGDPDALRLAEGTCEAMARGGMYDQLGGGFARYSVDAGWVVPHFEKMLYDNALLARVYANLWRLQRLRAGPPGGGGDVRLDAARAADRRGRSRGVAGRRQRGRRRKVLRLAPGRAATRSSAPRTASSPRGRSASPRPARSSMAPRCCSAAPTRPADADRLARVRDALLAARGSRVRPARDDKVVAAWNGLAVSALAECGLLFARPNFVAAARDAATLLATVHLAAGRLARTSRDGNAGSTAGALDDYACTAGGFLTLSGVTGEARWMELAGQLLEVALGSFGDGQGGFYDTAADDEPLIFRPADPADNATPSGTFAVAAALLQLLRAGRLGPAPGGRRGGPRRAPRHRGPLPPGGRHGPGGGRGLAGRAVGDRGGGPARGRANPRAAPDGAARGPARRGPRPRRRHRARWFGARWFGARCRAAGPGPACRCWPGADWSTERPPRTSAASSPARPR